MPARPGASGLSWKGESMWMPRVSGAYTLGERTVIKGGYGLFFDTLNAGDYTGFNQLGYSSATTNVSSTDFGQTWLLGDPSNGISPLVDPFPVRARRRPVRAADRGRARRRRHSRHRASRARIPIASTRACSAGGSACSGSCCAALAVEIAYSGSYADRVGRNINEVYVPEQYYSTVTNVRDATQQALLQQQVPNPFNISNFASLATTNPALYAADGRQRVLHRRDGAAADAAARLPAAHRR